MLRGFPGWFCYGIRRSSRCAHCTWSVTQFHKGATSRSATAPVFMLDLWLSFPLNGFLYYKAQTALFVPILDPQDTLRQCRHIQK